MATPRRRQHAGRNRRVPDCKNESLSEISACGGYAQQQTGDYDRDKHPLEQGFGEVTLQLCFGVSLRLGSPMKPR